MKKLIETRHQKLQEMDTLLKKAQDEGRAFTPEEKEQFDALETAAKGLLETINAAKRRAEAGATEEDPAHGTEEGKKQEEKESRAFANYIRGVVETRAEVNMAQGENGAVIPTTVAKKIIEKVYEISPLAALASRYNVAGNLIIPKYDEETHSISVAYADEFTELESKAGKFLSVELKDFLAGALTKISKSLAKKTNFDLTSFVVRKMAEAIAKWLEKEMLYGTNDKIEGLDTGIKQKVTAGAADKITADELIDVQEEVPDIFQKDAIWIMSRKTRKAIRKLNDNEDNYLLNRDVSAKWGYTLLGKDVYVSENMKDIATGNTVIFYGDMSGLALKIAEDVNIQVLREKFATQHALGVVGWVAADAKVEHTQKLAKLTMA